MKSKKILELALVCCNQSIYIREGQQYPPYCPYCGHVFGHTGENFDVVNEYLELEFIFHVMAKTAITMKKVERAVMEITKELEREKVDGLDEKTEPEPAPEPGGYSCITCAAMEGSKCLLGYHFHGLEFYSLADCPHPTNEVDLLQALKNEMDKENDEQ